MTIFGEGRIVDTTEKKVEALKKIMEKYAEVEEAVFDDEELGGFSVVEILVKRMTGKQRLP